MRNDILRFASHSRHDPWAAERRAAAERAAAEHRAAAVEADKPAGAVIARRLTRDAAFVADYAAWYDAELRRRGAAEGESLGAAVTGRGLT